MHLDRRTLAKGTVWTAPLIAASTAIPAYAASSPVTTSGVQYGLFVSTTYSGGRVGQTAGAAAGTGPTTPQGYFDAVNAGNNPESDFSWDDATQRPTPGSSWVVNGEGSFTPVTNSRSGADGSYAAASGFWFSVPTANVTSGSDYVLGGTATLEAGATFISQVEYTVPAQADFLFNGNQQLNTGVQLAGSKWNKVRTGTLGQTDAAAGNQGATYLQQGSIDSTWTAQAPQVTINPDGSGTFRGTITLTTSKPLTVTANGKYFYGQVLILPQFSMNTNYATSASKLSVTSYMQSGTISYTANGVSGTQAFVNDLTTTSTLHWR